jgi:hypothetical protein
MERLFIFLFGLTLTICGAVWGLKRWRLRRNGVRTVGVVVGLSRSGVVRPSITPIVEFKTDAGNVIRFHGSTGQRGNSPYQQGQQVNVIYSRQYPWNAQIANFEQFWLGPVSIGFFGLIVLGVLLSGVKFRSLEGASGAYWAVGLMVLFGVLFAFIAASEYRFYRIIKSHRKESNADLLAKIDDACRLYPAGRETLMRLRTAVVNLKDGDANSAATYFLDQVLRAHDREDALKEIQNLAKALDMIGKS